MIEDILSRQEYVNKLIEIVGCVSKKKNGCCFSIDGQWGIGKTYVLDMFCEQINQIQSEETNTEKYFVFNYNCWKYDYYEEPSIAIVSAMLDRIQEEETLFGENTDDFLKSSWAKVKEKVGEIAGEFSKNKIGINLVELVKDINDAAEEEKSHKYEFDKMFLFKQTLNVTREKIAEIAKERPVIFIVDELDRCLPSYAIKVLERLHHLFEGIENVTIIISIDKIQLEHSIQQIYGPRVDVNKYLKKFISFSVLLDDGNLNTNYQNKYKDYFDNFNAVSDLEKGIFHELFTLLFNGIDIRTQEKLIYKAKLIHETICGDEKLNPALLCFELMWIVFKYKTEWKSLRFVLEINHTTYTGLSEKIGQKMIDFLKKYENLIGNSGRVLHLNSSLAYRECLDRLMDNTFWIFASMYHRVENDTCFKYFREDFSNISPEMNAALNFKNMSEILI